MSVIINFLLSFFFGVRVEGKPINLEYGVKVPCSTYYPDDRPEQFSWFTEFRVSCLHGKQHVHL